MDLTNKRLAIVETMLEWQRKKCFNITFKKGLSRPGYYLEMKGLVINLFINSDITERIFWDEVFPTIQEKLEQREALLGNKLEKGTLYECLRSFISLG